MWFELPCDQPSRTKFGILLADHPVGRGEVGCTIFERRRSRLTEAPSSHQ
jgi:hypothetical protein